MAKPTSIVFEVRSGYERTGWIHPHLAAWMVSLVYEPTHKIQINMVFGVNGLAASANAAAKNFLETPAFSNVEWMCMIDNDTVPPHDILRMIDDIPDYVDIVSPLCPMTWAGHVFPQQGYYKDENMNPVLVSDGPCNFFHLTWEDGEKPGLCEVHRVGGGCWFIRRRVFEAMEKPYFKIVLDPETYETTMTDDLYFQDQAQRLGFRLFCDTRYVAQHHHTMNLSAIPMDNVVMRPDK